MTGVVEQTKKVKKVLEVTGTAPSPSDSHPPYPGLVWDVRMSGVWGRIVTSGRSHVSRFSGLGDESHGTGHSWSPSYTFPVPFQSRMPLSPQDVVVPFLSRALLPFRYLEVRRS